MITIRQKKTAALMPAMAIKTLIAVNHQLHTSLRGQLGNTLDKEVSEFTDDLQGGINPENAGSIARKAKAIRQRIDEITNSLRVIRETTGKLIDDSQRIAKDAKAD